MNPESGHPKSEARSPKQVRISPFTSNAVHFDMETTGGPSRWNTLRAARVMAAYGGTLESMRTARAIALPGLTLRKNEISPEVYNNFPESAQDEPDSGA